MRPNGLLGHVPFHTFSQKIITLFKINEERKLLRTCSFLTCADFYRSYAIFDKNKWLLTFCWRKTYCGKVNVIVNNNRGFQSKTKNLRYHRSWSWSWSVLRKLSFSTVKDIQHVSYIVDETYCVIWWFEYFLNDVTGHWEMVEVVPYRRSKAYHRCSEVIQPPSCFEWVNSLKKT